VWSTSVRRVEKKGVSGAEHTVIKVIKGQNLLISRRYLSITMNGTISIRKDAILDLVKVKNQFDSIIESLELMADSEFMDSYKESKGQIKKREFVDWNEL